MSTSTNNSTGSAAAKEGQSFNTLLGSISGSAALFGLQFLVFYLLKNRFTRIYRPKTYLVPEKLRTAPPPTGLFRWIIPVFTTSNATLISKCGLDAYFFLRFLRMLLKIFIPSAIIILPILIPINNNYRDGGQKGLDRLGFTNYDPHHTDRLWAHLILAIILLLWALYVIFYELRGYIRVRQAYLTSPQHRLRASATTVLVNGIPRKWLTYEALDGLYDVFPGGIRNIWINRNCDGLNDKVKLRDKLATMLEGAETALIRNCKKKHAIQMRKGKSANAEQKMNNDELDAEALNTADLPGLSSGNPHQAHTVGEALGQTSDSDLEPSEERSRVLPIAALDRGVDALNRGFGAVGHGISGFGKKLVGDMTNAPKLLNERVERAYGGAGFSYDGTDDQEPLNLRAQPDLELQREQPQIDSSGEATRASKNQSYESQKSHFPATTVERTPNSGHQSAPGADTTWSSSGLLQAAPSRGWKIWQDGHGIILPSPEPKRKEDAELKAAIDKAPLDVKSQNDMKPSAWQKCIDIVTFSETDKEVQDSYPVAFNDEFQDDAGGGRDPEWKKYLAVKDRDTTRLPAFGLSWMPHLPSWTFIGQKVDTIYYCRRELARLNTEIEQDQQEPEKFPLMNSAFIQFNHQIAAHMACQSLTHHVPNQMAPRIVEIAPDDIIWDNLSMKWWERYVRIGLCTAAIAGLVIAWAFPVSFVGSISNLQRLQDTLPYIFGFLARVPPVWKNGLQGILPPLFLAILLAILPIILRWVAKQQGNPTGMDVELTVQSSYFAFSFVQLFLVVTISRSIFLVVQDISRNPSQVAFILAKNVPSASNFFFGYMLLQAFTISAGSLAQVVELVKWFILRPIMDNTARQKFQRQLNLPSIRWGTFFPVYSNLACISFIFSIIAPLVMVFSTITFGLFWVAYRYQTLYVSTYKFDTGGLLFPKAINQLFVGIYVLEIVMIGLFFLVRTGPDSEKVVCLPQAVVMIVALVFTLLFQILVNHTFSPLYRYMPITLEDDAVRRDEEFERATSKRWQQPGRPEVDGEDVESRLERQEREEAMAERKAEAIELQNIKDRRMSQLSSETERHAFGNTKSGLRRPESWADRTRSRRHTEQRTDNLNPQSGSAHVHHHAKIKKLTSNLSIQNRADGGLESGGQISSAHPHHQRTAAVGDALFGGISDELEDLTAEERDVLVQRAFQHEALRSRRPVIWLPRDDLGVSDDEIRRTQVFSDKIWISNEFTRLDPKGRVIYTKAPPDFSEVDLISL